MGLLSIVSIKCNPILHGCCKSFTEIANTSSYGSFNVFNRVFSVFDRWSNSEIVRGVDSDYHNSSFKSSKSFVCASYWVCSICKCEF